MSRKKLIYNNDNFPVLEQLYHKGQDHIWNGKEVLSDLVLEHGVPDLSDEERNAIGNIFSIILWGELAAWNISAKLSMEIESVDAKLAATSQVHDEARHFYVMRDYLSLIGVDPKSPPNNTRKTLSFISGSNSLEKRLIGMQLMIEPIAITIFKLVRQADIDPVLSGLLKLYEKDEARHIALGVKYLPDLIKKMSRPKIVGLFLWQMRLMMYEVSSLGDFKKSFRAIGIDSEEVYSMAEKKQMDAARQMGDEIGLPHILWRIMSGSARAKKRCQEIFGV